MKSRKFRIMDSLSIIYPRQPPNPKTFAKGSLDTPQPAEPLKGYFVSFPEFKRDGDFSIEIEVKNAKIVQIIDIPDLFLEVFSSECLKLIQCCLYLRKYMRTDAY